MHVCNDKRLITNFMENPTKIRGSTLDNISLGKKKVKIRLILKNRIEGLVLILTNVFYLSNNLFNLASLSLQNNAGIYYHNKNQILYNLKTQKAFIFTKSYKTSFFLYLLNLSTVAVNLVENSKIYQKETPNMNQKKDKKQSLIC